MSVTAATPTSLGSIVKFRRLVPSVLAGGLLASVASLAIPAGAAPNYNPVMTASRSNDAARAAADLHVDISQADGEHQVGKLRIGLPTTYTFDTDVPGSDGAQIGVAQLSAYVNPRPSTLVINATVHDGNDNCAAGKQCALVKADIPGVGAIEFTLEIAQTATEYLIEADLTGLWSSDYVRGIDARLKQLTVDIDDKVGAHTVFGNPATAGDHPFTYSFQSAKISALGHPGGLYPDCGVTCSIPLESKEYAPTRPNQNTPSLNHTSLDDTVQTFTWSKASDANGDAITYSLAVDGPTPVNVAGLTANNYNAGTLAAGNYTWQVTAVDATGLTTASTTRNFVVLDSTDGMRFVSLANGDDLLVKPGFGFVYRVGGVKASGAEFGGRANLAPTRGVITYSSSRFNLNGAYDGELGTAVLTFTQSDAVRPFVDPAAV